MSTEHRLTLPLRWRDMDMLGHLNQAVYHEFLEEGRSAVFTRLAEAASSEDAEGMTWVVARVELDYKHEVRRDHGTVEVVVRVERVGSKSVTLGHEILLPDGTVAASGLTVLVGWSMATRGARELLPAERAVLEA